MSDIERVEGYCPMGCGRTLFLGNSGYVTCSWLECSNPSAASRVLCEPEVEHIVVIREGDFTIQHPLRERLDGDMFDCELHRWLTAREGPPAALGRYRVRADGPSWTFEQAEARQRDVGAAVPEPGTEPQAESSKPKRVP